MTRRRKDNAKYRHFFFICHHTVTIVTIMPVHLEGSMWSVGGEARSVELSVDPVVQGKLDLGVLKLYIVIG